MSFKIGIDVGGTFTDLFLWASDGRIETFKVLSTPADPSVGVIDGLRVIANHFGTNLGDFIRDVTTIVHGTTVTTNATLTRSGAKTGLLTTAGVRDALEMRRGIREEQYDNRFRNVVPVVPRYLRRPVRGRLDYRGNELSPLEMQDIRDAVSLFRKEGIEAVAVCFMNSFANPDHEQKAAEVVSSELPGVYLGISSKLLPTIRFYNRISTTALDAYVGPVLHKYLAALTKQLASVGFGGVLLIMQSNGGVALPEVVMENAATTLLSGPAAGPRAAAAIAKTLSSQDCVVVDMGGTSFDASLVRGGDAAMRTEGDIDRLRIALPMLDITTIGAGGGSIGWIDEGGLLRMGPQSAGALPGPACYGRGGERPTSTDANLVLGYLDPDYFAGGKLRLDVERARDAILRCVAQPLGLSLDEAAAGMYRVINTNMAHGVREITVKRGLDPREFPMVVAGGAGALHACMIAHELEMPTLVVPRTASVLCAAGMLLSDIQHDFVRSYVTSFAQLDRAHLRDLLAEMTAAGEKQLLAEGIERGDERSEVFLDLRYVKQYHDVTVPVPAAVAESGDLESIAQAFHSEHNRLYGYDLKDEGTGIELINVRVRAIGRTDKPALPKIASGSGDPSRAQKGVRRAFVPEDGTFAELPVYAADLLCAGDRFAGPALVERADTTIVVSRSYLASVDEYGNIILSLRGV